MNTPETLTYYADSGNCYISELTVLSSDPDVLRWDADTITLVTRDEYDRAYGEETVLRDYTKVRNAAIRYRQERINELIAECAGLRSCHSIEDTRHYLQHRYQQASQAKPT